MASPWAGRIKNIRTSWECDPLRTCFYQHSSNVGLCCKIGLRRFECVESLSLQELAFITIHPMLACAVKQMIRWNQYCSIVNCREPLNHVAAQHWTSAQELHIILCCFLIFWYLSNTFFPCSSSMVSLNIITYPLECPVINTLGTVWLTTCGDGLKGTGYCWLLESSHGAFTLDVKSVLNENLGGILGGMQCYIGDSSMLNEC